MKTPTIYQLVKQIKIKKCKPIKNDENVPNYQRDWSKEEEQFFCQLICVYGSDFSLLKSYFPLKTRKQLQRKFKEISTKKARMLQKFEQRRVQQRKKSFFDEEMLGEQMIEDYNKRNNSEGSSCDCSN